MTTVRQQLSSTTKASARGLFWIRVLSIFLLLVGVGLIVLGAYVATHGSGCFGALALILAVIVIVGSVALFIAVAD